MDINEAWKSTCKVLLGDEIGDLREFEEYLLKYIPPTLVRTSAISGKEVAISSDEMCESAKFISNGEMEQYEKIIGNAKLGINEIKDIDSILAALGDKLYYAGNIILGNSANVEHSDRCIDSYHVYRSNMVLEPSRFIAFSNSIRKCDYAFGCTISGEMKFTIHGYQTYRNSRCMEVMRTFNSSDCYFAANLEGCTNCMFSFNLRNKRNAIGNLELQKEKYESLKGKLVSEIREMLRTRKTIPTIVDIIATSPQKAQNKTPRAEEARQRDAQSAVEKAFETTAKLLFGKELKPLAAYEAWLGRHVGRITSAKSRTSNKPVYIAPDIHYLAIRDNVVKYEEALELGKKHLPETEVEELNLSNAGEKLAEIKCTTPEIVYSNSNFDVEECDSYGPASHAFRSSHVYGGTSYTSNSYWPRESECIFGSSHVIRCRYCIKCYNSTNLTRCFEVEGSTNCSDCCFCHNSENLDNCMFCFNTKSKRYAIGNVEIGKENYARIKKMVIDEIAGRFEKEHNLALDVFNVGCYKSKN